MLIHNASARDSAFNPVFQSYATITPSLGSSLFPISTLAAAMLFGISAAAGNVAADWLLSQLITPVGGNLNWLI